MLLPQKSLSHLALSLVVLLTFAGTAAAAEMTSLRDTKTAKKLDVNKISLFGPRAGKFKYDKRLVRAAEIADARAHAHSRRSCWRYVKNALLAAGMVDSRPSTGYAKEAAYELT